MYFRFMLVLRVVPLDYMLPFVSVCLSILYTHTNIHIQTYTHNFRSGLLNNLSGLSVDILLIFVYLKIGIDPFTPEPKINYR